MAASKLSPQERLMRKRTAARLRQQRCRARKRQAMMERANNSHNKTPTTPTRKPSSQSTPPNRPTKSRLPPRKLWKSRLGSFNPHSSYWSDDSDDSALRSRASSFDSLSSFGSSDSFSNDDDIRRNADCPSSFRGNSSPSSSMEATTRTTASSRCSPVKFHHHLLPSEEEAAVNAMLSLKKNKSLLVRPVPTVPQLPVYYSCWNNSTTVFRPRPRILPVFCSPNSA